MFKLLLSKGADPNFKGSIPTPSDADLPSAVKKLPIFFLPSDQTIEEVENPEMGIAFGIGGFSALITIPLVPKLKNYIELLICGA